MKLVIRNDYDAMSEWAANHIANAINSHKEDRPSYSDFPPVLPPSELIKDLWK